MELHCKNIDILCIDVHQLLYVDIVSLCDVCECLFVHLILYAYTVII